MLDAQAKRHEALLLAERDRALAALQRIEAEEAEPQGASAGDTVRSGKGHADTASDTLEQESDFLSATRLSERLAEVDDALRRLREEANRFGVCRACGKAVDIRRLELVPWSPLCASCAREPDQASGR